MTALTACQQWGSVAVWWGGEDVNKNGTGWTEHSRPTLGATRHGTAAAWLVAARGSRAVHGRARIGLGAAAGPLLPLPLATVRAEGHAHLLVDVVQAEALLEELVRPLPERGVDVVRPSVQDAGVVQSGARVEGGPRVQEVAALALSPEHRTEQADGEVPVVRDPDECKAVLEPFERQLHLLETWHGHQVSRSEPVHGELPDGTAGRDLRELLGARRPRGVRPDLALFRIEHVQGPHRVEVREQALLRLPEHRHQVPGVGEVVVHAQGLVRVAGGEALSERLAEAPDARVVHGPPEGLAPDLLGLPGVLDGVDAGVRGEVRADGGRVQERVDEGRSRLRDVEPRHWRQLLRALFCAQEAHEEGGLDAGRRAEDLGLALYHIRPHILDLAVRQQLHLRPGAVGALMGRARSCQ